MSYSVGGGGLWRWSLTLIVNSENLFVRNKICLHCASHKLGSHFQWFEFNAIPLVLKCVWPDPTCCWERTISQGHQK